MATLSTSYISRQTRPGALNPEPALQLFTFFQGCAGYPVCPGCPGFKEEPGAQHKNKKDKHYEFTPLIPWRECCYCSVVKFASRQRIVHGGCSSIAQKSPQNPDHHFFLTAA